MTHRTIEIEALWDHPDVPAGEAAERGLLLSLRPPELVVAPGRERPPVNLALVLDRSGSMAHGRLAAARAAAIGIARRLGERDRLSIVAYDHDIETLLDAAPMGPAGRAEAEAVIAGLTARGTTDLAGGWLAGARCVAEAMDRHGLEAGHVIVLSDGHANRGETGPDALASIAAGLAERGVTSTSVGIGSDYSPLQLGAIAEGGQGELHHSSEPDEIVEVLMGELGEATHVTARAVHVEVLAPEGVRLRQLTRYGERREGRSLTLTVGNLVAGQARQLALLAEVPPGHPPSALAFKAIVRWMAPGDEATAREGTQVFPLNIVDPDRYDRHARNPEVSRAIAELWLARQGYEAMEHNERGDFAAAAEVFACAADAFDEMVADLDEAPMFLRRRDDARRDTSHHWDGMSKREAMSLSRKRMRGKADFRSASQDRDWSDYRPD